MVSPSLMISSLFDNVTQGPLLPNQHLYTLNLSFAHTGHHTVTSSHHIPSMETWHSQLGHANYQTITEMAKAGLVLGMPTSFASKPPRCDSSILGKQSWNAVPKVWEEGQRATRKLEMVWVDLTRP